MVKAYGSTTPLIPEARVGLAAKEIQIGLCTPTFLKFCFTLDGYELERRSLVYCCSSRQVDVVGRIGALLTSGTKRKFGETHIMGFVFVYDTEESKGPEESYCRGECGRRQGIGNVPEICDVKELGHKFYIFQSVHESRCTHEN